jgi:hypothetical protein
MKSEMTDAGQEGKPALETTIGQMIDDVQSMKPALETQISDIIDALKPIKPMVIYALESIKPMMDTLIEGWRQHKDRVFAELTRVIAEIEDQKNLIDAFHECNLWVCPSMSKEVLEKAVALQKEGKAKVIPLVINNYYRRCNHENLCRAVEAWRTNPYFAGRMPIFEQALEAHIQGYYALIIPALLAQAEGIASEYVHRNNLAAKLGKSEKVITEAVESSFTLSTWAIVDTLLNYVVNSGYMYTDFNVEIVKPHRAITRHTILHGIQPNYHSQINSLKAFLLLDALSILQEVQDNS